MKRVAVRVRLAIRPKTQLSTWQAPKSCWIKNKKRPASFTFFSWKANVCQCFATLSIYFMTWLISKIRQTRTINILQAIWAAARLVVNFTCELAVMHVWTGFCHVLCAQYIIHPSTYLIAVVACPIIPKPKINVTAKCRRLQLWFHWIVHTNQNCTSSLSPIGSDVHLWPRQPRLKSW